MIDLKKFTFDSVSFANETDGESNALLGNCGAMDMQSPFSGTSCGDGFLRYVRSELLLVRIVCH